VVPGIDCVEVNPIRSTILFGVDAGGINGRSIEVKAIDRDRPVLGCEAD
jgi:hypothetical protein